MRHPEKITPLEAKTDVVQPEKKPDAPVKETEIRALYVSRRQHLEELRHLVSLKFYHFLAEKLEWEEKILENLLASAQNQRKMLSRYSLVLDPRYFEQKFFTK